MRISLLLATLCFVSLSGLRGSWADVPGKLEATARSWRSLQHRTERTKNRFRYGTRKLWNSTRCKAALTTAKTLLKLRRIPTPQRQAFLDVINDGVQGAAYSGPEKLSIGKRGLHFSATWWTGTPAEGMSRQIAGIRVGLRGTITASRQSIPEDASRGMRGGFKVLTPLDKGRYVYSEHGYFDRPAKPGDTVPARHVLITRTGEQPLTEAEANALKREFASRR